MERGEKKHAVTCVRVCAYLSCERKNTALAGRSVLVLLFFIVVVVSWRGGSRTVFRPPRNPYASHACIRVILCESPRSSFIVFAIDPDKRDIRCTAACKGNLLAIPPSD